MRHSILAMLPKNAIVAEIGVLGGDWSDKIIKNTTPEKLVLIDTFCSNDYPHLKRFTKNSHFDFINSKFSTPSIDIRKGLSWECLSEFEENTFDWIYVDAAHDYKSVKKDLVEVHRVLKPNGYIIMNDYIMHDHIMKEDYGVVQATNEFMLDNNFEMLCFALHPDMFCDVLIKEIPTQ
ncbi:MAG: class I SAM-dependent methyltransferase [Lentisphaeria bacterium]|nr:class I SAM-dependent methyltransferase [Lentisphaeria bacterium]